ncbi:MAG: hypothetical protein EU539_12845 [Promethearchaeota archaeon]|nr:MAG: hypothetical protein EU539_12845 [Candidatus Lokiarchaeota archaeon]
MFVCSIIWNSAEALILSLIALAVIIPFFLFNKFPSKVFPGDVGTLSIGTMIACIALFGSLEVVVFCAMLIHVFNSLYVIYSLRGFFESSTIQENKSDIILLEDDSIKASYKKDAALTLPRLILAQGPLKELELVKNFYAISFICGFFSLIALLFIKWTLNQIDIVIPIIAILILLVPTVILLIKFPRIRGVITLMITLLLASIAFLILIEILIMPINYPDINLIIISIPVNILFSFILYFPILVFWYYITIKYFWTVINRMKEQEMN